MDETLPPISPNIGEADAVNGSTLETNDPEVLLNEYADFVSAVLHASVFSENVESGIANLTRSFLEKHPDLARDKAEPIMKLRKDLLRKLGN